MKIKRLIMKNLKIPAIKQFRVKPVFLVYGLLVSSQLFAEPLPEIDCLVEPNKTIELSSSVPGVLANVLVDRSDSIKKNQVVAMLNSDVAKVKVRSSREKVKLSRAEYKRAVELYSEHVITLSEKELADNQLKLYQLELEQAQANLEQRKIRSPIDAVVVDRYRMPGEYVNDNPVLKIAQLDPLRVEIIASAEQFGKITTGMHAHVETEFAGYLDLVAEVVLVDRVIDAASGTFGVRLKLANEDYEIPGGLKCKILFFNEEEETAYIEQHSTASFDNAALSETNKVDFVVPVDRMESCRSIGPFSKKSKMLTLMEKLDNDIEQFRSRDVTTSSSYHLVTSGPFKNKTETRALISKIKKTGIKDIAMMMQEAAPSISFGLFKNEETALARQLKLSQLGFDSSVVLKSLDKKVYWADILADKSDEEIKNIVIGQNAASNNLLVQACAVNNLAFQDSE